MLAFTYLICLMFVIGCLTLTDWRYRLAYFSHAKQTVITLSIGVSCFILWDLAGIGLGIFFHGNSDYTLPIRILPEFPIEELFFYIFFVTLLYYYILERKSYGHVLNS